MLTVTCGYCTAPDANAFTGNGVIADHVVSLMTLIGKDRLVGRAIATHFLTIHDSTRWATICKVKSCNIFAAKIVGDI